MNTKKKRQRMTILGVALMVIAIVAFSWYEWLGGREWVNYTDVLVLKDDVLQGEIITQDKLKIIEMDKNLITESTLLNPKEILNKAAQHFIPKQTPLHANFFGNPNLVLEEGEFITQVPIDWTLSVPNTLRRGDEIIVYAATYDSDLLKQLRPQNTVTVSSNDGETTETKTPTSSPITNTPMSDVGGALPAVEESSEFEELFTTNVAFVKDSSNKEVVTTSAQDRIDGSSSIENIEIIVTTDELEMLEDQIKVGAKLIIMYSNRDTENQDTDSESLVDEGARNLN